MSMEMGFALALFRQQIKHPALRHSFAKERFRIVEKLERNDHSRMAYVSRLRRR